METHERVFDVIAPSLHFAPRHLYLKVDSDDN
jgi:hypothetical protein